MRPELKLAALGLVLPPPPKSAGNYVPYKRFGDAIYLSGRGARGPDGKPLTGKVGREVSPEEAYAHARLAGLTLLSAARDAVGDLTRIEVVKFLGFVNAAPDFTDHPKVINGCSDLFVDLLGENGRHARSAVGMGSLPHNMTVEIEAVMRIL